MSKGTGHWPMDTVTIELIIIIKEENKMKKEKRGM